METTKNNPTRVANSGGMPVHTNGSVGTTQTLIDVINQQGVKTVATAILIKNTSANVLSFSLDGSANYYELEADESVYIPACFSSLVLLGSGASTTYQSIITV